MSGRCKPLVRNAVLLVVAGLAPLSGVASAQVVELPEDDHELIERYAAFEDSFRIAGQGAMAGGLDDSIEATLALYPVAQTLHPGAEALVADRLARYYALSGDRDEQLSWSRRALDVRLADPAQGEGVPGAARSLSAALVQAGRMRESAEALLLGDHPAMSEEQRSALYRQIADHYSVADMRAASYDAYSVAIESGEIAGLSDPTLFNLYYARLIGGLDRADDPARLIAEYEAVYDDPRFRGAIDRVVHLGWQYMHHLTSAGEYERAIALGREVLRNIAEIEEQYGYERGLEFELDEGYTQASISLHRTLSREGRTMEALEVLESAYAAYPDARLAESIERDIRSLRTGLELEPDA